MGIPKMGIFDFATPYLTSESMIALATRIGLDHTDLDVLRIAHIFELQTSRTVADELAAAHPTVSIVEHRPEPTHRLKADPGESVPQKSGIRIQSKMNRFHIASGS